MQQRAIDQADMVRRDQHAGAGRRQILHAADLDAEQRTKQQRAEVAHAFAAPFAEHEPDRAKACDRKAEEDPGDRKTKRLQSRDEQRAGHHEGRLQHVAGGDHAGSFRWRGPCLDGGKGRYHEQAAANGEQEEVGQHPDAGEGGGECGGRYVGSVHCAADGPGQIETDDAHHDGADRHQREIRAHVAELRGKQRACGNTDREHGEADCHDAFGAADAALDQRGQQRQHDRADHPEPGHDQHAVPQARFGVKRLQKANGGGPGIRRDRQIRRGRLAHGDTGRECPGQDRQPDHGQANPSHMRGACDKQTAGDRADQDRHEGRALDKGVAGCEFGNLELIGKDRVFHRAEQGCHHAEQRERREQQRDRMHVEAGGRKAGGKYFGELQASRDGHLDEFVGQFAAERRKHEKGKDKDRTGQRHQWSAFFGGHAIEQHDDERILQYIVVQGRAELRPEQRGEAMRGQQFLDHDISCCFRRAIPDVVYRS